MQMDDVRTALSNAGSEDEFSEISRQVQLERWNRQVSFCSLCSAALQPHTEEEIAKVCSGCGHVHYPPISPCIIVLVKRGEYCLLAHAAKFNAKRYSTLAGFIEPGETAEQAVIREVKEEVGVNVCNIRYMGSQSWPFPHALMLGFFADYESGEIVPDGVEILEAAWFHRNALPDIPARVSISRRLIDTFVAGKESFSG